MLIDLDDNPVQPSTTERVLNWVNDHTPTWFYEHIGFRFYDWWLDRPCWSCGLERVMHAGYIMGGCTVPRGS